MAMRMDYEVHVLDDSFKRNIVEYGFEPVPNGRANRWGEKPQRMVKLQSTEQSTGGVLIKVKGKPGHSFRITSLEQALDFKLIDNDEYHELKNDPRGLLALRPRLFDLQTGEQVNEQGIPLNIARELAEGTQYPKRGRVDENVDVNTTGDENIAGEELPADESIMAGHEHVEAQIDITE